ncbi:hypothetical protein BDR06DRAFT_969459 [Suillus hirtellus]|nr:hypothetical protein BDR06DRAFT_969459 [Suillus hirtellus]
MNLRLALVVANAANHDVHSRIEMQIKCPPASVPFTPFTNIICTNCLSYLVLTNITQTNTCITTTLSSQHIMFSPPYPKLKYSICTKPENLQLQVSVYTIFHTLRQVRHSTPLIAKGGTAVVCNEEGSWCNSVCYNDLAKSMASLSIDLDFTSCAPSLVTVVWAFKINNATFRVFYDVPEVTEHDSSPGKYCLPTRFEFGLPNNRGYHKNTVAPSISQQQAAPPIVDAYSSERPSEGLEPDGKGAWEFQVLLPTDLELPISPSLESQFCGHTFSWVIISQSKEVLQHLTITGKNKTGPLENFVLGYCD